MNFRTQIKLQPEHNQIDYNSHLLLLGSCFSTNIYNKFNYFKFNAVSNPFGISYNPAAIATSITNVVNKKKYTETDVFKFNERWHSFDAHSSLSSLKKNEIIEHLNSAVNSTYNQLIKASHLFITLGTAWVYKNINDKRIVNNCHKLPAANFNHQLLSVDEIVESLQRITHTIKSVNSACSIIFTVSPVRHLKDGFIENTISKAHLLTAINNVKDKNSGIFYFPSYEIMIDDLRDYRFYNDDLLHPNNLAVDYIWEQLKGVWINTSTETVMKKVDAVQKSLAHKPFNPTSNSHQKFLAKLTLNKQFLIEQYNITF